MPQYIDLSALIRSIIESTLSNNGYTNPKIDVKFNIEWHGKYQLYMFNSYIRTLESNEYHEILVPNYLDINEPIQIYMDPYRITYKTTKVTKLTLYNLNGWNKDQRCRRIHHTDPETEPEIINQEWYGNYTNVVRIKKEITLQDIANAVFEVKSGKLDNFYEAFMRATCELKEITDNEVELCIDLMFDHGS